VRSLHFSAIVALGIFAFVAEMSLLLVTIRRCRTGRDPGPSRGTYHLLTVGLALGGALLVPCLVAILVNRGRSDLIEQFTSPWLPRFENMTHPLNQIGVLRLGAMVALPSLVLAGVTLGAVVASRCNGRAQRILLYSVAPAILGPFFLGVWFFLNRLRDIVGYPRSMLADHPDETALAISKALAAANQVLDQWAYFAVFALVGLIACLAIGLARNWHTSLNWLGTRCSIVASVSVLAIAGVVWWISGPLARENQDPFPGHSDRRSRRLTPAIPAGLSQGQLYDLVDGTRMGFYREPLVFPLVLQEEDKWLAIGCRIEVSKVRVSSDGLGIYDGPQELKERLEQCKGNARILHPGEPLGSPVIEASPNGSMAMLSDVLAVVYDLGWREIRLVTGVPQTIQRPLLGPISRAFLQTTSVAIMQAGDFELRTPQTAIRVAKGDQHYRDLLDQVLAARRESRASVLVLDPEGSSHENRWSQ
jgi:hypothetical protein